MTIRMLLVCAAALAACAQDRQNPAFALPDSVSVQRDVVYSRIGSREMHLDLFLPKEGSGPFPAVVYIHGGGWVNGSKAAFQRQAAYMATKGFAGACIEYRLSGEAKYPAAIDDAEAAVRWMRAHAQQNRVDPNRIGAAGGSAGGHLVALLGVKGEVQAVAAFNPVLDMVILGKEHSESATKAIQEFLGKTYAQAPELWAEASPAAHAGKSTAPMLLLHGDADTTVPYQQSVDMLAKLKSAGVRAELFTAKGAKHGFFNSPPFYQPALERMEAFFAAILKP
jgi:gluconolactonase